MRAFLTKHKLLAILVFIALVVVAWGVISLIKKNSNIPVSAPVILDNKPQVAVIGQSVEGRDITAYTYGQGETRLFFVGGIHGGYEWNSVLLAYKFMDYLEANSHFISKNLIITVVPSANPDGIYKVTGKEGRFTRADVSSDQLVVEAGRFNAHEVDLNRNFACKWQPKSTWRERVVSAGTKAFSEPEAIAIRDFVLKARPVGVIFWHSQANAVYASECESGILPETLKLMDLYTQASGYQAIKTFDQYAVSGDAGDWLASLNIPAITVELKTHENIDWEQNLAGIKALFNYYQSQTRVE